MGQVKLKLSGWKATTTWAHDILGFVLRSWGKDFLEKWEKLGENPQFFVDQLRFSLWKIKSSMASKRVSSCECLGDIFRILHGSMRRLRFA